MATGDLIPISWLRGHAEDLSLYFYLLSLFFSIFFFFLGEGLGGYQRSLKFICGISTFSIYIWININRLFSKQFSVQFSSVAQLCLTLCDPKNRSTPGPPVYHQLPEFTQTHVHRVSDAIQPSHPLSSPSPPAPNPSQHQSLFQWVNSSHEVAKVLEFQL